MAGPKFSHWFVDAEVATGRFSEAHELAEILRDHVGGLDDAVMWPVGCPAWAGPLWRNWERAVQHDALTEPRRYRSLVVWLRYAHDQGWGPGLWTAQDLLDQPTKPGLMNQLTGRLA